MAGVTVEQLAKQIGVESSNLIEQLKKAGVVVKSSNDLVTDDQKQQLLSSLRKEHGGEEKAAKSKISLKRKSVSSLQVKNSAGRNSTVKVVNKRRRVYVKRDEQEEETIEEDNTVVADKTVEDKKVNESSQNEVATEKVESKTKESEVIDSADERAAPKTKEQPVLDKDSKKEVKKKASKKVAPKKAEGYVDASKERKKTKAQLLDIDSDRSGRRRKHKIKKTKSEDLDLGKHGFAKPTDPVVHNVKIPETITVAELSQKMTIKAGEVIKTMMKMGVMATINQVIDQDTACLIVEEMGHKAELVKNVSIEDSIQIDYDSLAVNRPPIVTVMGHVDHGKTSLLDTIRRARVTDGEAGGITQHIGAYQVKTDKGLISFLDTPGHSAFTAMRARGANCTDLVVLVVAADDGVMPQTVEAIQHAKAAKVPIIVAINKVDKEEADINRVTNELSQHELIPESWGGDTQFIEVSAKAATGIDDLLDAIMLQSEMLNLKAVPNGQGQGVVIESCMDRGRGAVATVLVQNGSLKKGDMVLAGLEFGRIRAMMDDNGKQITEAGPSVPVEILGLSGAPMAGDTFQVVEDERKAREVALFRQNKDRELRLSRQQASKLEGFMNRMQQGDIKNLNIILKADVQGSVEALVDALENLTNDEIIVKVVSKGVGGFNESDINLAMASQGILLGFNVRADATARRLAQQESIEINYYSVIYDVIDGVKAAIGGKLGPTITEKIVGIAEVRDVFKAAKIGSIAGCMVTEGTVKRGNPIRVLRDNVVIYEGELESLRRFKDNVNEVKNNMECGIGVKNYNDVKAGDQIEVFERVEVRREF